MRIRSDRHERLNRQLVAGHILGDVGQEGLRGQYIERSPYCRGGSGGAILFRAATRYPQPGQQQGRDSHP